MKEITERHRYSIQTRNEQPYKLMYMISSHASSVSICQILTMASGIEPKWALSFSLNQSTPNAANTKLTCVRG